MRKSQRVNTRNSFFSGGLHTDFCSLLLLAGLENKILSRVLVSVTHFFAVPEIAPYMSCAIGDFTLPFKVIHLLGISAVNLNPK